MKNIIKKVKARVFHILPNRREKPKEGRRDNYFSRFDSTASWRKIKNKRARLKQKRTNYQIGRKKGSFFMWELW